MAATLITLCDQIVTALNGHGGFSLAFTAVRRYVPLTELKSLGTLAVSVVPSQEKEEAEYRGHEATLAEYAVDIGVQKKLDPAHVATDLAQCDALMALVEEIGDFLRETVLTAAAWISRETLAPFDWELLDKQRQFTSVIRLTYRCGRAT